MRYPFLPTNPVDCLDHQPIDISFLSTRSGFTTIDGAMSWFEKRQPARWGGDHLQERAPTNGKSPFVVGESTNYPLVI